MFRTRFGSSTNDNAGLYNKGGVSIKRSTPAEVASASTDVAAVTIKPWKRIVIPVIAVIAMVIIALFSLSGCGGSNTKAPGSSGSSSSSPAEPVSTKSVDDYTWEELSEISEEISKEATEEDAIEIARKYNLVNSNGKLDGTQTKTVQLTDGTTATVQIAGFLHDDKISGGKAGITFIFKDAIAEHDMNPKRNLSGPGASAVKGSNAGGWEGSAMCAWLSTEGLSMLPPDLADRIVAVDKRTNNVGETADVSSVTTTSDKFWLFSRIEVYGVDKDSPAYDICSAEGAEYKLFRDCNVGLNRNYQFLKDGFNVPESMGYWWLRSPDPSSGLYFYCVYSRDSGSWIDTEAYLSRGVVPGFCI